MRLESWGGQPSHQTCFWLMCLDFLAYSLVICTLSSYSMYCICFVVAVVWKLLRKITYTIRKAISCIVSVFSPIIYYLIWSRLCLSFKGIKPFLNILRPFAGLDLSSIDVILLIHPALAKITNGTHVLQVGCSSLVMRSLTHASERVLLPLESTVIQLQILIYVHQLPTQNPLLFIVCYI